MLIKILEGLRSCALHTFNALNLYDAHFLKSEKLNDLFFPPATTFVICSLFR